MFPLLHDFRIMVRLDKTGSCQGGSSISIVLSANHSPRSREGAGGWNLVPMWGLPLMFLLSIKPLTWFFFPPISWWWCDVFPRILDHDASRGLLYKVQPLLRENLGRLYGQFMFHQQWRTVLPMWRTRFITSVMKERKPFWPEPLIVGSSWKVDLPVVHAVNSPCNLMGDDAVGAMSWSRCNSPLSCANWGFLWLGIILG